MKSGLSLIRLGLEGVDDVRENVTDGGSKQSQDNNHDDGYEHQDKRVFYETLALFTRLIHHDLFPPFFEDLVSLKHGSLQRVKLRYHNDSPIKVLKDSLSPGGYIKPDLTTMQDRIDNERYYMQSIEYPIIALAIVGLAIAIRPKSKS